MRTRRRNRRCSRVTAAMRRKWRQQDAKEERKHQREKHVQLVAAMASNLPTGAFKTPGFTTSNEASSDPKVRVKVALAILKEAKKQVK